MNKPKVKGNARHFNRRHSRQPQSHRQKDTPTKKENVIAKDMVDQTLQINLKQQEYVETDKDQEQYTEDERNMLLIIFTTLGGLTSLWLLNKLTKGKKTYSRLEEPLLGDKDDRKAEDYPY